MPHHLILAQAALEDLVTHDVPGASDIHANEQDGNGFTAGILHRLILGDIALAKQQGESAIDITAQNGSQRRAGAVELGADSAFAVFFAQGGCDAHKAIAVAHEQGRNRAGALEEVVRYVVIFVQLRLAAF